MEHDAIKNYEEVEKYRERLSIALKAAKICVFEVELCRQLYTFFENAEDIFGVSGESILNDVRPFSALSPIEYQKAVSDYFSHPDDEKVIAQAFNDIWSGQSVSYEARMRAGGSSFKWCKLDISPIIENGIPVKIIGVITDISNLKARTEVLQKEAQLDEFTGLFDKAHTISAIKDCLTQSPDRQHALVFMDIDNFKLFNDTYGHAVGDSVILGVANSLKSCFRKTDIVGRFGGDEFLLLIRDIPNSAWLCEKLSRLLICQNRSHTCTCSIGVSLYPDDAREYDELFSDADRALYTSKATRMTYTFFSAI